MATTAFRTFVADEYSEIVQSIKDQTFLSKLSLMKNYYHNGAFDLLKKTISLLVCFCDLEDIFVTQSNLSNLKELTRGILTIMIEPLIEDLKKSQNIAATQEDEINAQILSKWWLTYIALLNEAFTLKKNQPHWSSSKENWFPHKESKVLSESLKALEGFYHWKMVLLKGCLLFSRAGQGQILESFIEKTKWKSYFKNIGEMILNFVEKELETAKLNSEKRKRLDFRIQTLDVLRKILQNKEDISIQNSILRGKFEKRSLHPDLSHTVILGWDGGLYALFNTITEDEKEMLLEGEEITKEYAESWKKNKRSLYKIVIGKGTLGKIRLCISLTLNETSPTMKPGEVICLKKCNAFDEDSKKYILDQIIMSVWNDYSSGEMGRFVFSPDVHDMMLIVDSIDKKQKGYTIQEFVPVFDGNKIFQKKGKYYNNWEHQKNYLLTVFQSVLNLLNSGICMTDLKPANTLYDAENGRGMLIDLAGVVRMGSAENLKKCKIKYLLELTEKYTDPIIFEKHDEETVNLFECTAFTFGKFIENVALNIEECEWRPYHEILKQLSTKLMIKYDEFEEITMRPTIEQALKELKGIQVDGESPEKAYEEMALEAFIKTLLKETRENLSKFGLNPELPDIANQYIKLSGAQLNPDIYEHLQLEDLQMILQDFIEGDVSQMKERVMVLLGSSGSGKSTVLQLKYLKVLEDWKKNDPVPLFINLAVEDNLKQRWNLLSRLINQNIHFTLFSGIKQYPMILFVDSFDEMALKMNYVSKFLKELGNNNLTRCLICCRSEFVQKDQDFVKWFSSDAGLTKWFIAPLLLTKFNLEEYAINHYERITKGKERLSLEKKKEILFKIKEQNLKPLLRTGYMVHLSLEVLPEILHEKQKITRRIIYEKYSRRKIEMVCNKRKEIKMIFIQKYNFNDDKQFIEFIEESAQCLARILHKIGSSKVSSKSEKFMIVKEFFDRHFYKSTTSCLENKWLEGIIRLLDLNVEIRGNVPNEEITIGFNHDSMKNYFLICGMIKDCHNDIQDSNILGEKLIVEDVFLVKFIEEVIKENQEFSQKLMDIVLFSRHQSQNGDEDKRRIIAAANAITLLVASNIGFSGSDLSKIRICGANINDGMFSMVDFSEADLAGVFLENYKLDGALFYKTKMAEAKLGVYPEINTNSPIKSCCFSPEGEAILAGSEDGCINLWDRTKENKLKMSISGQTIGEISKDGKFIVTNGGESSVKLWDRKTGSLLKTFEGHSDLVSSLCFSSDGNLILSGSYDKTLKLWDRKNGALLRTFEGHSNSVTSVCFSTDGNLILSGSNDKCLKLWDKKTGSMVKIFEGHSDSVTSVCFFLDGNLILSGSSDKTIKLWDWKKGILLKTFEGHSDSVNSVCCSIDGNLILSGSSDKTIKLWDRTKTESLLKTFEEHSDSVNSVRFSLNGNLILSGSSDKTVKLLERKTGTLLQKFEGHSNSINSVCFSLDGNLILTGSWDKTVKLWDPKTGYLVKTLAGHSNSANSVCFSPEGNLILSGSCDNTIKIWDRKSGHFLHSLEGHSNSVNSVCFSPEGNLILSGSSDKTLKLWDRKTGLLLKTFEGHVDLVFSVGFSPDGKLITSGSSDKTVKLWDSKNGFLLKTLVGHSNSVLSVCFSPDGNRLLSGSNDNTLKLWDQVTGCLTKTFIGHSNSVNSVLFSSDGNLILSGSSDKTVKLWDQKTGSLLKNFAGHSAAVYSACFSLDENLILSGSSDKTLKIWDRKTGSLLKPFEGHSDAVNSVSFSNDGNLMLSGSNDKTVKLWDRITGSLMKTLEGHSQSVNSVNFSPDGNQILSASSDKTIRLWDLKTGSLLKSFEGHYHSVNSVCFSNDGTLILSGSSDKNVKLWDRKTGSFIKTFSGHYNSVNSIYFSPDSNRILSGSLDNSIKMWNRKTGFLLKTFDGHSNSVTSVCFSNDGNLILSGSWDGTVKLWDSISGSLMKSFECAFEGHYKVSSVCFSPNNNFILSGSSDNSVLLDRKNGALLKTFEGHSNSVTSVCFSPDGNFFASGSRDKTLKLWVRTGSLVKSIENQLDSMNSLCFSPNGKYILSGSWDNTVNLWDRITGSLLQSFEGHSDSVNSVCFSPDSNLILSASSDKTVKLRDRITGTLLKTFEGHSNSVSYVTFSPDGNLILSSSWDNTVKLWNRITGSLMKTFEGHSNSVNMACFSPDGSLILSGSWDNTMKLWDRKSGLLMKTFSGNSHSVTSVSFFSDGDMILSGSTDKTVKVWDRKTGTLIHSFNSPHSIPLHIQLLLNKNLLNSYNFVCSLTLSNNETQHDCKNMLVLHPVSLSLNNIRVFLAKNAIIPLNSDILADIPPKKVSERHSSINRNRSNSNNPLLPLQQKINFTSCKCVLI